MSNIVKLNINNQNREMAIKEYKGQRIVTLRDVDELHQRPEGTASRNFIKNKNKFIEGEDYFQLTKAEIQSTKIVNYSSPKGLTILTESGYLMLVKSFADDLAWEVQRQLVNNYFRAKEIKNHIEMIAKETRSQAMLRNAKTRQAKLMKEMAETFIGQLSPESIQLLLVGATEVLTGQPLLPKPKTEVYFTATDIAEEAGVSPNKTGRVSNKYNVKNPDNGMWVLDKSASSSKQVNTFVYNVTGREKLLDLIKKEMRLSSVK